MLFKRLFNFFKKIFRGAAISVSAVNLTTKSEAIVDASPVREPTPEVKEQSFFQRENILVAEFVAAPTKIYSSNFDSPDPIGEMDDNGNIKYYKGIKPIEVDDPTKWIDEVDNSEMKRKLEKRVQEKLKESKTIEYKTGENI